MCDMPPPILFQSALSSFATPFKTGWRRKVVLYHFSLPSLSVGRVILSFSSRIPVSSPTEEWYDGDEEVRGAVCRVKSAWKEGRWKSRMRMAVSERTGGEDVLGVGAKSALCITSFQLDKRESGAWILRQYAYILVLHLMAPRIWNLIITWSVFVFPFSSSF